MQNNVTDLSQKLQRSLDNNYNVIDLPTVIEVISALEKTAVTKELLETTRLGKYINELRRRTSNESLAKRAKDLLKKWRGLILPDANGQIKRSDSPAGPRASKKRSARPSDSKQAKRPALNGQNRELDFSDNSNCSVKDLKKTEVIFINSDSNSSLPDHSTDATHSNDTLDLVDTSSNSAPKKRGRKKGSKNHKNLLIAAEESFSNKMAVSRNSKVKTTQELLADLQNRTSTTPKTAAQQEIELRAAQLTESLSRIDQKLNPQKTINKNVTPIRNDRNLNSVSNSSVRSAPHRTLNEVQSWPSRTSTPEVVTIQSDDEIVDVEGTDLPPNPIFTPSNLKLEIKDEKPSSPLTIEGLLAKLPSVDPTILEEEPEVPPCLCPLPPVADITSNDRITVNIVEDSENREKSVFAPPSPVGFDSSDAAPAVSDSLARTSDSEEDISENCAAKNYLKAKYLPDVVTDTRINQLHADFVPNVNGNFGERTESEEINIDESVVPRIGVERLSKDLGASTPKENFQKYSISINDDSDEQKVENCDRTDSSAAPEAQQEGFREWHETVDVRSYNDELLRILPYVIID